MSTYARTILLAGILMSGCGPESAPAPGPPGGNYRAVRVSGDVPGHCVFDGSTGLTWEVKSTEPGLHHRRNTYSWFAPDEANDELDYRGAANGGSCSASDCDTWDFVRAVNAEGSCGYDDWRVPSRDELRSISDLTKAESPPTINTEYFPFTEPDEYWSANDYSFQFDAAWAWNFRYGHDRVDWKRSPKLVRLVRGEAAQDSQ
jgi:hypothetical protein